MDDIRVDFLFTLYFIGRKVRGHYRAENKDLMLSAAILHLLQNKPFTITELSKVLFSKLSSLSEKITAMENEGLVKKENTKEDEREQRISLTSTGRKQVVKTLEEMKTHCVEFTKEVTNEELTHITPLLKKMAA